MRIAKAYLKSISPYSQSRHHAAAKREREGADDYAQRTWREHLHVNGDGNVMIPGQVFKNCLAEAAKYLSMQIPGKNKQTYTKHFEAGVLFADPLVLPLKKEDVACEKLFLPSDGKRGSGKRVWKYYPVIHSWEGELTFYVLDDIITEDVLRHHLREAGNFIGIGRFRPRMNGYYGRFTVERLAVDSSRVAEVGA